MDSFTVRNLTQFHLARTLSMAFIRSVVLDRFQQFAEEHSCQHPILGVLAKLYGCWCLEQHEGDLVIHGLLLPTHIHQVRLAVLHYCSILVPDSILLTDILSPTDFILNSVLGPSSGNVYQSLQQAFLAVPKGFERAEFWDSYTDKFRDRAKL